MQSFSCLIFHSLFSLVTAVALGSLLMTVSAEESTRNRIQVSTSFIYTKFTSFVLPRMSKCQQQIRDCSHEMFSDRSVD